MKSVLQITKVLASFGLVLSIAGCMPSSRSPDNAQPDPLVDVTSLEGCSGPALYASPDGFAWYQQLHSDNNQQLVTRVYFFAGNLLSLHTTCSEPGITASVPSIQTHIGVLGNRISILAPANDRTTAVMNGKTLSCESSIPQESWTYRIVGKCLQISRPNQMQLTLPLYTGAF